MTVLPNLSASEGKTKHGIQALHLNRLTLRFAGPTAPLESLYKNHYISTTLTQIRISFFLGAVLYGFFGILDAVVMPEQKHIAWFIRYAIVCPLLLAFAGATYLRSLHSFLQPTMSALVFLGGLGIVYMTIAAPEPIKYYYYAGLILVLMFGYSFVHLQFLWASLAGWLIVISYNVAAVLTHTPQVELISNNFFLVSANLAGMLICYTIDYMSRRNFFFKCQIEEANEQLELRVTERTADFEKTNCRLSLEISKHAKAVEALRESEERFRFLVDHAYDLIWILRPDGVFSYVSPSWKAMLGYEPSYMEERAFQPFVHPDDVANCEQYMVRVLDAREALPGPQYRVKHADGSWRWHEAVITPVFADDGSFMYFVGVSRDITDRKLAEDALRASEEKNRVILANTPSVVYRYAVDAAGTPSLLFINDEVQEILGYAPEDFIEHMDLRLGSVGPYFTFFG